MPEVVVFLLLRLRETAQERVIEQLTCIYFTSLQLLTLGAISSLRGLRHVRVIVAKRTAVATVVVIYYLFLDCTVQIFVNFCRGVLLLQVRALTAADRDLRRRVRILITCLLRIVHVGGRCRPATELGQSHSTNSNLFSLPIGRSYHHDFVGAVSGRSSPRVVLCVDLGRLLLRDAILLEARRCGDCIVRLVLGQHLLLLQRAHVVVFRLLMLYVLFAGERILRSIFDFH